MSDHDFAWVPSKRRTSPGLMGRRYGRCQRLFTGLSKPAGRAAYTSEGSSHKLTVTCVLRQAEQGMV